MWSTEKSLVFTVLTSLPWLPWLPWVSLLVKLHRDKEETLVSKVGTGAVDPSHTRRDLGYDRHCAQDQASLWVSYCRATRVVHMSSKHTFDPAYWLHCQTP